MSKKIKKSSALFQNTESKDMNNFTQLTSNNSEISSENENIYDSIIEENEKMKSMIATYLDDIDNLKQQISALNASHNVNCNLDDVVNENSALKLENDNLLLKISELTFENAKLNAQIMELSQKNHITNNSNAQNKKTSSTRLHNMYPKNTNSNGYSSWN